MDFEVTIRDLDAQYASHPLTCGTKSYDGWLWTFYLFGKDSDGLNGRLQVHGRTVGSEGKLNSLTVPSSPLSIGEAHRIRFEYSADIGGLLFVNGVSCGAATKAGPLVPSADAPVHVGQATYSAGGRTHSPFVGAVAIYRIKH